MADERFTEQDFIERLEAAVAELRQIADTMYDAATVAREAAGTMQSAASTQREAAGSMYMAMRP